MKKDAAKSIQLLDSKVQHVPFSQKTVIVTCSDLTHNAESSCQCFNSVVFLTPIPNITPADRSLLISETEFKLL